MPLVSLYTPSKPKKPVFFMFSAGIKMTSGMKLVSDTHKEKLNSVAEFIEVISWLLLIFSIYLRNQLVS